MGKRKEQPPDEGAPAWMATFSDLMNLLLCFFVLLFASSTLDEGKIQKIAASFENVSFSIIEKGVISILEGQLVSGGVTQLPGIQSMLEHVGFASEPTGDNLEVETTGKEDTNANDTKTNADSENEAGPAAAEEPSLAVSEQQDADSLKERMQQEGEKQSEQMYEEIKSMTESYAIDDRVIMDYTYQYVQLDMNGAILFNTGQADIRSDARLFMQKIASILARYKSHVIEIEGHTDNVPIRTKQFESNRYLSTARATKVYEYLMEQGSLIDKNIKVAGYGESRPIASNETEEGRARNRRVTIKIYNQLHSESD